MSETPTKRLRIVETPPGFKRAGAKEVGLREWVSGKIYEYTDKIKKDSTLPANQADALIKRFCVAIRHLEVGGYFLKALKALADYEEKSYALIRKWRTESAFLKLIDSLAVEFTEGFLSEYLYRVKLLFGAMDEASENPVAQKHLAETATFLPHMLLLANNDWGLIIYQKAHERLPALIRQQEDPRFQGQLYALLLICCLRSKGKLNLKKDEALRYKWIFRDFLSKIRWNARIELEKGHPLQALYYMDVMTNYAWLFHEKLVEPYIENDIVTMLPSVVSGYDNRDLEKAETK